MSGQPGTHRVFVYGSLLSGEVNHDVLRRLGACLIGPARTIASFTLHDVGRYPAMVEGGTTSIRGEVYELTAEAIADLDRFEDVPHGYRRVHVSLQSGETVDAYVVDAARAVGWRILSDGDWRARN